MPTPQALNSYCSLIYIAFLKNSNLSPDFEYCHDLKNYTETAEEIEAEHGGLNPYCMNELATQLTSLVVSAQLVRTLSDIFVPILTRKIAIYQEEKKLKEKFPDQAIPPMSLYEEQNKLAAERGVFKDYSTQIIQFGYVVLFAPAFPIASLVCWLGNLIEVRSDAYRYLVSSRRPPFAAAQDIGTWMHILLSIVKIGIFTK